MNSKLKHLALFAAMMYRAPNDTDATGEGAAPEAADVTAPAKKEVVRTGAVQPAQTAEEKATLAESIKANFNNKVDVVDTAFHFRKVTDEKTKIETKRNSVVLPLPVPSVEGIIDIIQTGGKGLELLQEAVRNIVVDQAREYVNDNEDVTSLNFPFDRMSWETIANLPKADRRGGGISADTWKDFVSDYVTIMPALIGKTKEAVENAGKIYLTKFGTCRSNKPVLNKLKEYLAIYINNTQRGEEFAEAVDWLDKKIDNLLETGDANLLNAL